MPMRSVWLICLLMVPAAAAAPTDVLDDGSGDVHLATVAGGADDSTGYYDPADMLALTVDEDRIGFDVTLHVASLEQPVGLPIMGDTAYTILFVQSDTTYRLGMQRFIDTEGTPVYNAWLHRVTQDSFGAGTELVAAPEVTVDASAGTLQVRLQRQDLIDGNGAPPRPGDALDDMEATATTVRFISHCTTNGCQSVFEGSDRMPDDGTGAYQIREGVTHSGLARLTTPLPYRMSNGGATTVVFDVTAHNDADEDRLFSLGLQDVPEQWSVGLPSERLRLDAGDSSRFPVLVTTPSGHSHGGVESFIVEMTSLADPDSVGRAELGLAYTSTPQPAGHHSKLWLHSRWQAQTPFDEALSITIGQPYAQHVYMNAAQEDALDDSIDVPGQGAGVPGVPTDYLWRVPLQPSLAIGLDFDTDATGTLSVPIGYDYLAQDVTLSARLVHHDAAGETVLAEAPPSTPVSFGPDGSHVFDLPLAIKDEADYIAFQEDAGLLLELQARGTFNGVAPFGPGSAPAIQSGAWLELPLIEYHDPVDAFYDAAAVLAFSDRVMERLANPGATVVFTSTLRNGGDPEDVRLNLTGTNADWARILGASQVHLGAGEERRVAIAVEVPADIVSGAVADLVLTAHPVGEPQRRALVEMLLFVDDSETHPDDSDKVAELDKELRQSGKRSPGVPAVLVAGALVLLALERRGR